MLAAILASVGCGPTADPLKGWKGWGADTGYHLDKAILDDRQKYIDALPTESQRFVANQMYSQTFWEDGTGQHAVEVELHLDGKRWRHILIYDKSNKRIKVIKYVAGRYSS